jgi:hypothetical protein
VIHLLAVFISVLEMANVYAAVGVGIVSIALFGIGGILVALAKKEEK